MRALFIPEILLAGTMKQLNIKYKINNNYNNKKEDEEEEQQRNLRDTVDGTGKAIGKQIIFKVEHSAGTAFVSYDGDAHTVGRDVGLKHNDSATQTLSNTMHSDTLKHNALGHSDTLKHNALRHSQTQCTQTFRHSKTQCTQPQTLSNTMHSDTLKHNALRHPETQCTQAQTLSNTMHSDADILKHNALRH